MYRGATVGVVVPAYNEEGLVGDVIELIPEYVDVVYAVDDASTDGTWEEIRRHARLVNERNGPRPDGGRIEERADGSAGTIPESASRSHTPGETTTDGPWVVTISHEENRGVGGAIKSGYRRAVEDGVDVIAVVSGDGQMDTEYLSDLLDPVVEGRVGFAKGTRVTTADHRSGVPRWRLFGTYLLTALTRIATGYWTVTDVQNGYTVVSRDALTRISYEELYEGFGFINDMLARLSASGIRVADVPHPPQYGEEESSIRYRTFVPTLSTLLLRRFLDRVRSRLPDPLFLPATVGYFVGASVLALGAGESAAASLGWAGAPLPGSLSRAVFLLGMGGLLILTGFGFDLGSAIMRGQAGRVDCLGVGGEGQ